MAEDLKENNSIQIGSFVGGLCLVQCCCYLLFFGLCDSEAIGGEWGKSIFFVCCLKSACPNHCYSFTTTQQQTSHNGKQRAGSVRQ